MEKMVEVERATQEELRQDLKSLFQGAIRVTLEMVLEEELKAMVGARRFERVGSRKDHRNGTYLRRLLTSLGQIDVMVPRSREGGSPADVMGRYRRRSEEVDEMMVEAYVSGVSQRKMGDVTEALLGERVGRSTVSRVAKRLDGARHPARFCSTTRRAASANVGMPTERRFSASGSPPERAAARAGELAVGQRLLTGPRPARPGRRCRARARACGPGSRAAESSSAFPVGCT